MEVVFDDPDLDRLETDPKFDAGLSLALVRSYRKTMGWIWAAADERDFYGMKSLHYEKLKSRPGFHSMRLNDQFRLIVRFDGAGGTKKIRIVAIEDYH